MTWEEVCAHPDLQDLPFRIETNRWGQVVMSPPHNDQFFAQASIYNTPRKKTTGGDILQQAVIDADDGHKVADGVWMSEAFLKAHKGQASFKRAPEICVEVKLPSNSMKELLKRSSSTSRQEHVRSGFGRNPARCVFSTRTAR